MKVVVKAAQVCPGRTALRLNAMYSDRSPVISSISVVGVKSALKGMENVELARSLAT